MHGLGQEAQLSYSHPWDKNRLQKKSMTRSAISYKANQNKGQLSWASVKKSPPGIDKAFHSSSNSELIDI